MKKIYAKTDLLSKMKHPSYSVANRNDLDRIARICHALSSKERIAIIQCILLGPKSVSAIAEETGIPLSSVTRYVASFDKAGMINVVLEPSAKGFSKYCYLRYLTINLDFMASEHEKEEDYYYEVEMPVGMFSDAQVTTPCGMTGENGPLNKSDDPRSFFAPQRKEAELLWFTTGYVTYAFPLHLEKGFQPKELLLSFEICSEAPGFKTDYLSDITFRINGIKVTTYRSPGDFGGRRGYRSPDYWPIQCTQFGLLKTIRITEEGAFLDDKLVNPDLKISTLNLLNSDNLKFTVAVEDDVIYKGGVNLFGKHFGDFHQSIKLIIR